MKISLILKRKGSTDVRTITANETIGEAASILSELRIGALVVSQDGEHIDGILSERDIVRRLGAEGPEILALPVGAAMTSKVETCTTDETAFSVLGRMTEGHFRHMPVADEAGRMLGILSQGDVVKARLEEIERENAAMAEMLSQ